MKAFLLAAYTLWKREIVRFYRQPSRVVGAFVSPLLFWVLLGSGIGSSFHSEGSSGGYLHYFFPGSLLMILFFTSIFTTISIIEDRREGFLQSVLVSPVPRAGIVFGKILGGSSLAVIQAVLFLFLAPLIGTKLDLLMVARTIAVLFINAFMLTGLGFLVAWRFQSIQGYHAVMNLFLMPLWMLSGALFPAEGASPWIQKVMAVNPLSYGLSALQISLSPAAGREPVFYHALSMSLAFGGMIFILASFAASRPNVRDLR